MKIKCRKCLLSEIDEKELLKSLEELKESIPEDKRCTERQYNERLSFCKECDKLSGGMCSICGCYVEFRALKADSCCPNTNKRW